MRRLMILLLAAASFLAACGGKSSTTGEPKAPKLSADQLAIQAVLRADVVAENAKNTDAFLALWTDKGLKEYDQGTREEIKAGQHHLGEDQITIVSIADPAVTGTSATVTVDASVGENPVVSPLFRVKFELIKQGETWLFDGFEFLGGPPPKPGDTVVEIRAQEYGFILAASLPSDAAFKFVNVGKEQHEMTLYRGPDGVSVGDAKAALENVDGSELKDIPQGYTAQHVSFSQPGESVDVTFAAPIPAGTYVFACYLPQGGFGENDEPVNPKGKPHIQLGMIAVATVA